MVWFFRTLFISIINTYNYVAYIILNLLTLSYLDLDNQNLLNRYW